MKVFGGRATSELTEAICRYLGTEPGKADISKFGNDNTFRTTVRVMQE